MKKAIFLDRDGTIIFDIGYMSDPAQVRLLSGAKTAITILRDSGYMLFLFTNQSGIGRGLYQIDTVHHCNQQMLHLLGLGPDIFEEICIAPEGPDQPPVYRKPSPRFINEAVARHALDRSSTWMVGDKLTDVESGLNAGVMSALIRSKPIITISNVPTYQSLLAFARAIAITAG